MTTGKPKHPSCAATKLSIQCAAVRQLQREARWASRSSNCISDRCRPSGIASTISGASSVSRRTRLTWSRRCPSPEPSPPASRTCRCPALPASPTRIEHATQAVASSARGRRRRTRAAATSDHLGRRSRRKPPWRNAARSSANVRGVVEPVLCAVLIEVQRRQNRGWRGLPRRVRRRFQSRRSSRARGQYRSRPAIRWSIQVPLATTRAATISAVGPPRLALFDSADAASRSRPAVRPGSSATRRASRPRPSPEIVPERRRREQARFFCP